jgi:hypothetical protein
MIKSIISTFLNRMGYEVRNISGIPEDRPPAWTLSEAQPDDDLIPGEWVSSAPEMVTHAHRPARLAYQRRNFGEDARIKYVASFLDLRGLRTLELGPCEGYWSILLEKMGVRENVAIELRPENLAKCQRMKDLHHLDRTSFVHQNIEHLYQGKESPAYRGPFDLVFCLGLLYHLPEPAKALAWSRSQAPRLFLGTHYYEPAEARRYIPEVFQKTEYIENGKTYRGMAFREGGLGDPISGASAFSFWPTQADLIAMVHDAGYSRVEVVGRDVLNRMPHVTLIAEA